MSPGARTLSMVTIFFEAEFGLLRLQARSLRLMADADLFEQVIVIDNTRRGMSKRARVRMDAEFGSWAGKVRYVRPEQVVALPDGLPGWIGQQVLKLAVHSFVRCEHYVVLDAKNTWNQMTGPETFLNPDGRARGASHTYRGHALEEKVANVMRYLDVDPESWIDHFPVTHTPVVLQTSVVRDLVAHVESTEAQSLARAFERADLLEFPLYSAFLISRFGSPVGHLDGSVIRSTTIWPSTDSYRFVEELRASRTIDSPFLAVHRKALARSTPRCARELADTWVDRGLFRGPGAALAFIASFKIQYAWTMSMRRTRQGLRPPRVTRSR